MITFKVSFLLSFTLRPQTVAGKKKEKKGDKNKEKPAKKESKKKKVTVKDDDKESLVIVFGPQDVLGVAHVDYDLVPGRIKYDFDVVCWKTVATISTRDGSSLIRTVIKNEKAWVPITIEHYIECLNTAEDIKRFRNHIVQFRLTHSVPKGIEQMTIMVRRDDVRNNDTFEKLQLIIHPDEALMAKRNYDSLEEYIRNLILSCANYPKNETVSWFNLPYRWEDFYEIIDKDAQGETVKCKAFVLPPTGQLEPQVKEIKTAGAKGKKEKNEQKSKNKKLDKNSKSSKSSKTTEKQPTRGDSTTIQVPGEIFFTDPDLVIYKSDTRTFVLDDVFVLLSVKQLMTSTQKLSMNPLVIKLKKLRKLPADLLKKLEVHSVYAQYDIPSIACCRSAIKPLAEYILFDEAHIFFNDKVPKIKVIEFMQTRRLLVEIYGIRTVHPKQPSYDLFGTDPTDFNISKIKLTTFNRKDIIEDTTSTHVLLAVASYDLSSLVDNVWNFRERAQCHEPNLTLFQQGKGYFDMMVYRDVMTVPEIHFPPGGKKIKSLVPESVYLEQGTTMHIEAYILAPQTPCLVIHNQPNLFKRMLMVIYDEQLAKDVFVEIYTRNKLILHEAKKKSEQNIDMELSEVLTGFLIDNGNNYLMFVEGLMNGFFVEVFHLVDKCNLKVIISSLNIATSKAKTSE
ncbi:unnamed protein product [Acanthoscelides obtectus]|uniref:DUF4550 domain-containing protein n=1 Tax=Acanthoscelides obtectus TaxID=200917 RepID=A0A9P0K734_ACAOB|nr:unnamed protein product [Acanthoscelides obtectus]CAK1626737.1 hypothetical protein AOBTE_LOCUS4054 [Acanthoscelides obtectus]